MAMNRRGFLARLSTVPLLVRGVFSTVPRAKPRGVEETVLPEFTRLLGEDGAVYQQVQALVPIRGGDLVYWAKRPLGVACADIRRGHYGYVQVRGRATVRFSTEASRPSEPSAS